MLYLILHGRFFSSAAEIYSQVVCQWAEGSKLPDSDGCILGQFQLVVCNKKGLDKKSQKVLFIAKFSFPV